MNTLSGRFRFVVFGVIVIVAVVSCCPFLPIVPNILYNVEIGNQQSGQYVEWKDDGTGFKQALEQVRGNGGDYCICIIVPGRKLYQYPGSKCPAGYECHSENSSPGNIRTVKVTKSKVADNTANGQSAVNDPNAFYRVRSPNPDDLKKVVAALATPTPMPTH